MTTSSLRSKVRGTAAVVIVMALAACGSDSGSTDPAPEAGGETTETTSPSPTVEDAGDAPGEADIADVAGDDHEVDAADSDVPGDTDVPGDQDVPGHQDMPAGVDEMAVGPGTATVVVDGVARRMDVSCTRFSSWFVVGAEERGGDEWRFGGSFDVDDPDSSSIGISPPRAGAMREARLGVGELHDVVVGDGVASGAARATFPEGDGGLDVVFELECPLDDAELPVSLQEPEDADAQATVSLGGETVVFAFEPLGLCTLRADGRGFNVFSLPSVDGDLALEVMLVRRAGEDSVGLSVSENASGRALLPDGDVLWAADSTRRGTIAALEVSDDGRSVSGAG
ncbi:MAG: hypothetical protein EA389_07155, partial [Ilumatobacter sp.]